MNDPATTLITIGVLFLLGLTTDMLGRVTPLPRVTLLLMYGIAIGPSGFDLLPHLGEQWFATFADMALVLVGFTLGEKLTKRSFSRFGRLVLWISIMVVLATTGAVLLGLVLLNVPIITALLLSGIAPSTAPAASADVVREIRAKGKFANTLLAIVAVDDAWGLIIFSIMLAVCQAITGETGGLAILYHGTWDLGGAVVLGLVLGLPMSYLTARISAGESMLVEALGLVFLCGGMALRLKVSFLLSAMVMGATVANFSRHQTRAFRALHGVEWPFMIIFFVLAGASLHVGSLKSIGLIGTAYVILRILGRLLGSRLGGRLAKAEPLFSWWMGLALLPQAGVAMGMALVVNERFPEQGKVILPVVIGATVLFELLGPVLTREALVQMAAPPHHE
jgi:Kef-type K+ transport system membrane component KefB